MSKEDLIPFKKGQSGNPKGRPKKLVNHITDELNKEGYKAVSKSNILDAYLTLIQLPYNEIKSIASPNDKTKYPFFYKLVAKELIGRKGSEMLEKLLDRALGKATQKTDLTNNGAKFETPQIIVNSAELPDKLKGLQDDLSNE